jgi:hydroxyacylglutathione hydrolase
MDLRTAGHRDGGVSDDDVLFRGPDLSRENHKISQRMIDPAFASLPIEDTAFDVLAKARRGLALTEETLAEQAAVSVEELRELLRQPHEGDLLRRVAGILGLGPRSLGDLASGRYRPALVDSPKGLFCTSTPFGEMMVNSFVVWDPATLDAAFFDTGADADPMLDFAKGHGLRVGQIFLTHIHGDHILDLDRVMARTGATAFVSAFEPLEGAEPFAPGTTFSIGSLKVSTRRTSGHADGGITYVVEGLAKPLAIVGDALFAGSMGGGMVSYEEALRTNRAEIFSLPDETILCAGHGPLSTVGEQKRANPFFAD